MIYWQTPSIRKEVFQCILGCLKELWKRNCCSESVKVILGFLHNICRALKLPMHQKIKEEEEVIFVAKPVVQATWSVASVTCICSLIDFVCFGSSSSLSKLCAWVKHIQLTTLTLSLATASRLSNPMRSSKQPFCFVLQEGGNPPHAI